MELLYIDESGSMTSNYSNNNPFFVISVIRVLNKDDLKIAIKRFVRSHWEELKLSDRNGRMFNGDKFLELKGSSMTKKLKKEFVSYLVKNKYFEVFYIVLDNRRVDDDLYNNTARAFNYMIKIALAYFINKKYITKKSELLIQIDERNERPEAKLHLQEYLNTELQVADKISGEITVQYYDSCTNSIIQLADFFANLMFSHIQTGQYDDEMKVLQNSDIIKKIFKFPPKK